MKLHLAVFSPAFVRCLTVYVAAAAITAGVFSTAACSSYLASPEGTWTATYFDNPDRVWNAIELALLELDDVVITDNRDDGVIRAESSGSDDHTVIALAIDQVMRTEDQVNVSIEPSFGGDPESADGNLLKVAADAFLKRLDDKLRG
jgi:hypothetical protein